MNKHHGSTFESFLREDGMSELRWLEFCPSLLEYAPSRNCDSDYCRGQIVLREDEGVRAVIYNNSKVVDTGWFRTLEEAKAFVEDCIERA